MIFIKTTCCVIINTISICFKICWISDSTSDWTTLVDFIHHIVFAFDLSVFFNTISIVFIWYKACLTSFAITAHRHSTTSNTVCPTTTLINRTSLISYVIIEDPFVGKVSSTTMATKILLFT